MWEAPCRNRSREPKGVAPKTAIKVEKKGFLSQRRGGKGTASIKGKEADKSVGAQTVTKKRSVFHGRVGKER